MSHEYHFNGKISRNRHRYVILKMWLGNIIDKKVKAYEDKVTYLPYFTDTDKTKNSGKNYNHSHRVR